MFERQYKNYFQELNNTQIFTRFEDRVKSKSLFIIPFNQEL